MWWRSSTTCSTKRSRPVASLIQSIPRSWASEPPAIDQPWCSSPTRFSSVDLDVGEEDLVEVGMVAVGQLGEGTGLDARRAHVDDENTDAGVLGGVGVGAHEAEAVVGVVGPGGPYLLAVHHELVADAARPGSAARRGRSRRRARSSRGTS